MPTRDSRNIRGLCAFVKMPAARYRRGSRVVEHVGIDHRSADILVPEEYLEGPGVVALLKEMDSDTRIERPPN